jgi:hypothetical protein
MDRDLLERLELLKSKNKFPESAWDEREEILPSEAMRKRMNSGVNDFISFLQNELMHEVVNPENLKDNIQEYLDVWDTEPFNTEETEHMLEIMCDAILMVNVNIDDLVI